MPQAQSQTVADALPVEATPDGRLVEKVAVPASSPDGASTIQALVPGESYLLEVEGTVAWGLGQADAECASFDTDPTYLPDRFAAVHPHLLDVLVDGSGVSWVPAEPDVNNCDTSTHVYRSWFRATEAARVNFRFHENPGYYPDNQGSFTVSVFLAEGAPLDGVQVDEFTVPANDMGGALSSVSLSPTQRYRVVVDGVYRLQTGPEINHDAECVQVVGARAADQAVGTPFTRQDELDGTGELKDVYVNNQEVDWVPSAGVSGCDEKFHTYLYEFAPEAAGPVHLRVRDFYYPDNQGFVTAKLFEISSPAPAAGVAAAPDPSALTLVEEVRVDASNPVGVSSLQSLIPGETYIFEAVGTVNWGPGAADAECATFDVDPTYLRDRFSAIHPHLLDVLVNGLGVDWMPTVADPDGCNLENHTYRYWFRATEAARVNFRFHETPGYYPDNQGAFTVRIFFAEGVPPDGTFVDQFTVPANAQGGVSSSAVLSPLRRYRVAVEGVYRLQTGPDINHDAECLQVAAGPFSRQDQLDETGELKDVYVNGREVDWVPSAGRTGCDEKFHAYLYEFTPEAAGPLHLRVRDFYYPDNQGGVEATIVEIGPPPPPGPSQAVSDALAQPPGPSELSLVEEVRIDSADSDGSNTIQALVPGEAYIVEVTGTYHWGLGSADAECATLDAEPSSAWLRDRYTAIDPSILDVEVGGAGVDWVPTRANPDGCNTDDHTYRVRFQATTAAPLNLRVNERTGWYPDNEGVLTARLFFAEGDPREGTLVDQFTLSSASQSGRSSTAVLQAGEPYRLVATGVYTTPDLTHDPECASVSGGPFARLDQLDDTGELKDVYVNGAEVDWVASSGRTGCDEKFHAYLFDFTPAATAPVHLRVRDFYYPDNRGDVSINVYRL